MESNRCTIISVTLCDTNTGEVKLHRVKDYCLDNKYHVKLLHQDLDILIRMLKSNVELNLEYRGYKRHEDLKLPF